MESVDIDSHKDASDDFIEIKVPKSDKNMLKLPLASYLSMIWALAMGAPILDAICSSRRTLTNSYKGAVICPWSPSFSF